MRKQATSFHWNPITDTVTRPQIPIIPLPKESVENEKEIRSTPFSSWGKTNVIRCGPYSYVLEVSGLYVHKHFYGHTVHEEEAEAIAAQQRLEESIIERIEEHA